MFKDLSDRLDIWRRGLQVFANDDALVASPGLAQGHDVAEACICCVLGKAGMEVSIAQAMDSARNVR